MGSVEWVLVLALSAGVVNVGTYPTRKDCEEAIKEASAVNLPMLESGPLARGQAICIQRPRNTYL